MERPEVGEFEKRNMHVLDAYRGSNTFNIIHVPHPLYILEQEGLRIGQASNERSCTYIRLESNGSFMY
jgi:hypothetical protein